MNYFLSWASVLTGMYSYEFLHGSVPDERYLSAAIFGGAMLAGHWCITRATTPRPVNRNVG